MKKHRISIGERSYELTPGNIAMFGDLIPFHMLIHPERVIESTGITVIGEWFEEWENGIPTQNLSMTLKRIHLTGFTEEEATPFAEAVSKLGNGIQVTM
jgi:hypothetical protein